MNITALAIALKDTDPDIWFSADALCQELDLNYWELDAEALENEKRLTKHWNQKWQCTDTIVGDAMYFFDGEPLAYSTQDARKSDEHFYFFSQEVAESAQKYLQSLKRDGCRITVAESTMEVKDYSDEVTNSRYQYRW